ncbi:acyltransferase 3 [Neobacillus bataviensis LMG 21833]|uniref:Acyltransferase 3 n=1 Tax=Neobacillus bataviensis LMG 21833 TaxID=1117379 RepID=K6DSK3_9BACI|nr:acyltransferase [Neobacillus bataviensis]EKN71339.1 acyltransferase 3 [Neobacillus bataviensis LMG 21833]
MLEKQNRIFGLDLARSIAIIFVVIAHGLDIFISPILQESNIGGEVERIFNYPLGFIGVEIFFILSGFLIGNIIIREIVENGSVGSLVNFYIRRWFRTLPLYYLVVIALIIYPTREGFSWANLYFFQNHSSKDLAFNPVSWSLSVEEWFYLTIPLIMLCFFKIKKVNRQKAFLIICFSIIVASLFGRIASVVLFNPTFDFGTRKQIFFRLDSITVGVILAGIKFYYRDIYNYLIAKRKVVFMVALTGLLLCELWFVANSSEALDASFFSRTFFFNLISLFCAALVLSLETVRLNTLRILVKPITFISVISYGLYLLHFHVYLIFKDAFKLNNIATGTAVFLLATAFTIVIAYFIYRYYELPMMKLRDKFNLLKRESKQNEIKKVS